MAYTKVHEDWEDFPSTTTPVTAAALEQIEEGIQDAHDIGEAAQVDADAAQATADAAIPKAIVDAKGDLIVATADNTPARLAVGANTKQLTADSAVAAGVKWQYGTGTVVNVLDYGALADDSTDNTAAFLSAVAAVAASGGMIYIPPGVYRGSFAVTANVPIQFIGYGAKIRPLSGNKAFSIATVNGDTAAGLTIQGVAIDGSIAATATTGIFVQDTDRVRVLDVRIDDCGVGIEFKVSTTGEWVEGCSVKSSWVSGCVKGILFNGTGTCSFSECVILDTGVQGCTTGIETVGGNAAVTNRMFLGGVTVWVDEGQKAVKVATSMKGAQWNLGLESFATTAATGVELATGTINADLWDLTLDFVGTFDAKTVILSGQDLVYRTSTADVRMGGSGTGGRGLRAYQSDTEAHARVEVGGGFSGGGGILLGGGAGAPEVQLYRNGNGILESNVQVYGVGGLTTKAQTAAPTDADFAEDRDGTLAVETTNNRLYVRTGGAWHYVAINDGAGGAGSTTASLPVELENPRSSTMGGLSFYTVAALTDGDIARWEMVKDVESKIYGKVWIPPNYSSGGVLRLAIAASAASGGVTRMQVATKAVADGESTNPTFTDETAQDITMPGVMIRKDVTFTLTETLAGRDLLLVEIFHDGDHANDTLTVNTLLLGAWLEYQT